MISTMCTDLVVGGHCFCCMLTLAILLRLTLLNMLLIR